MRTIINFLPLVLLITITSCKKKNPDTPKEQIGNLNFITEWSKAFGGTSEDGFYSGKSTKDGGHIVAGYTISTDGDIVGKNSILYSDALIVKFDENGNKVWQKVIGGTDQDYALSINQLTDGSYIGIGYTKSKDGDITTNHGGTDILAFKLDNNGNTIWIKTYGTSMNELGRSIVVNSDETLTLCGTKTNGSDLTTEDAWVGKIDQNGNLRWEKTYGGYSRDFPFSMISSGDGGCILVGSTQSTDGDAVGNKGGFLDFWIVKFDGNGNKVWHKTYGGTQAEIAKGVIRSKNGFIIIGEARSEDGDVTAKHGDWDAWVIKINQNGEKIWQKSFGGSGEDIAQCIVRSSDGGYLIGINSKSSDGDFKINKGYIDAWVMKIDEEGNNLGQRALGGSKYEQILDIEYNSNGGYYLFGNINSADAEVSGLHSEMPDGWTLKFRDQQ